MKKHLHNSLRALFLSLAVLLSLPMLAEQVEINGINYDLIPKGKVATVIKKSSGKYFGEVLIPESVEHQGTTYSVKSIGSSAFSWCINLTSVTIPNSVTSIGDYAFSDCSGLTSVTIPNSVTSIGEEAFSFCSGLTSVTIPNSVTSIGIYAFAGCSGLTSVTIPNSVTSIGNYAFEGCDGLTEMKVDANNSKYDSREGCNAIIETSSNTLISGCQTTVIPNSVTSIGESAFSCCSGLTSVTIPNSVTSIGDCAFYDCSGLTSVTIPNSVKSIGQGAFYNCSGLTSVTIGSGVKNIYSRAFANCPELLDVYCLAENVPSTDATAFDGSYIEYVNLHVPDASKSAYKTTTPWSGFKNIVALSPFSGEVEINGINYELVAKVKQATVIAKSSGTYSGKVVIPESVVYEGNAYSVTSIGDDAFYYCSGLTSVTIGNSVTSIGEYAFKYCSALTSVHIYDIAAWCNIDFKFYGSNPLEYAHHLYLNGEEVKDLVIPNSVKSIGYLAFRGCSGLTSVTIPNSVTSIGHWAFSDCSGLTSVTIPNSVTSIETGAFYGCSGLTSVTIPNSVKSIGNEAFDECSGLTSVHISDIAAWCNIDFVGSSSNPLTYAHHLYLNGEEVKNLVIPNSVTSIGSYAFYGCSGLTSVTIPNSVTSIGWEAFRGCSGLTSVTIGSGVKNIYSSAFANCPELLDVYCLAENVPSTDASAFEGSYIEYVNLHVPDASKSAYKTTTPWSGFGKITSISGTVTPLPNLTLTDGEEFENNTEQTLSTLTYTRTLPNLKWNALYVPFEIPVAEIADKYEVAYINDINSYDYDDDGSIDNMSMEIIKIKSGTLKANYPYMIKASNEEAKNMSITLENTTLYPTVSRSIDCSSVYARHEVTGIYERKTQNELPEGAMAISVNGVWQPIASGSYLNPFRLYMTITSRDDSPVKVDPAALSRIRISVLGEDEMETGVEETENGNRKTEKVILDLSGRRVQNPTKGGVYIINGKKMVY